MKRNYESINVTHRNGVTEVRFHTDQGPLRWSSVSHREAGEVFVEISADPDTKVVVITGTGENFCTRLDGKSFADQQGWENTWWEGKRIFKGLLDLDVPVIGAVNGPAFIHAEIPLIADIVLASNTTIFADKAHFTRGTVPGDGVHLLWPYLLGPRRAKYFLLTGQEIDADEALSLGVVNEILPPEDLNARAWELASEWATKPRNVLRYTRDALNIVEREQLYRGLSQGLALEGLAVEESKR